MVNLCIFDLDGLLVDSESKLWLPNETKTLNKMGYNADIDLLHRVIGGGASNAIINFKKVYGEDFDYELYAKLLYEECLISIDHKQAPLKPGVIELLNYLVSKNIDIRLGSSSKRPYVLKMIKSYDLDKYFSMVVSGDDVAKQKPDPDIYVKCLGNNNKDEAIIFEDAHNGLLAGMGAGIRVVLVPDISYINNDDLNNAYKVLNNLNEAIDIIKEENETTLSI